MGRSPASSFQPAISKDALNRINAEVRSWRLHNRTGHDLAGLAARINPIVRGWMQYFGAFYRSAIYPLLASIFHATVDLPAVDLGSAWGRHRRARRRTKTRRSGRVRVSGLLVVGLGRCAPAGQGATRSRLNAVASWTAQGQSRSRRSRQLRPVRTSRAATWPTRWRNAAGSQRASAPSKHSAWAQVSRSAAASDSSNSNQTRFWS